MDLKTPGGRLRYLRERKGETREELADALHYNPTTIEKYERGERGLTHAANKIAEHFGVSVDFILGTPHHLLFDDEKPYNYDELLVLKTLAGLYGISIVFSGTQMIQLDGMHPVREISVGGISVPLKDIELHPVGEISVPLKDIVETDLCHCFANVKNADGEIIEVHLKDVSVNDDDPIPFCYFATFYSRLLRTMEAALNSVTDDYYDFKAICGENGYFLNDK